MVRRQAAARAPHALLRRARARPGQDPRSLLPRVTARLPLGAEQVADGPTAAAAPSAACTASSKSSLRAPEIPESLTARRPGLAWRRSRSGWSAMASSRSRVRVHVLPGARARPGQDPRSRHPARDGQVLPGARSRSGWSAGKQPLVVPCARASNRARARPPDPPAGVRDEGQVQLGAEQVGVVRGQAAARSAACTCFPELVRAPARSPS